MKKNGLLENNTIDKIKDNVERCVLVKLLRSKKETIVFSLRILTEEINTLKYRIKSLMTIPKVKQIIKVIQMIIISFKVLSIKTEIVI